MGTILNSSETQEFAQSTAMTAVNVNAQGQCKGYAASAVVTVSAPAAGAFTAAVSDICTKVAHGYKNGLKVQVSNSGGALPTGLSGATDYYVIYLDADTFKLATSQANALAGTAIDITGAGTGTHTVTPQALAGCTVKHQASVDGTNWVDLTSTTAISAAAVVMYEKVDPMFDYARLYFAITGGQISVALNTIAKG